MSIVVIIIGCSCRSQHFAARKAEREAANYSGRRGVKGLDRESDKPPRQSDRSKPKFGVISFLLGHRYKTGTIDAGTEAKLSDIYSYRCVVVFFFIFSLSGLLSAMCYFAGSQSACRVTLLVVCSCGLWQVWITGSYLHCSVLAGLFIAFPKK